MPSARHDRRFFSTFCITVFAKIGDSQVMKNLSVAYGKGFSDCEQSDLMISDRSDVCPDDF
jgi:hypothetical protein